MSDPVIIGVGATLAVLAFGGIMYAFSGKRDKYRTYGDYETWYDDPYLRRESSIARDSSYIRTSRDDFGGSSRRRRSLNKSRKK